MHNNAQPFGNLMLSDCPVRTLGFLDWLRPNKLSCRTAPFEKVVFRTGSVRKLNVSGRAPSENSVFPDGRRPKTERLRTSPSENSTVPDGHVRKLSVFGRYPSENLMFSDGCRPRT
jgi:hypothetical protein